MVKSITHHPKMEGHTITVSAEKFMQLVEFKADAPTVYGSAETETILLINTRFALKDHVQQWCGDNDITAKPFTPAVKPIQEATNLNFVSALMFKFDSTDTPLANDFGFKFDNEAAATLFKLTWC